MARQMKDSTPVRVRLADGRVAVVKLNTRIGTYEQVRIEPANDRESSKSCSESARDGGSVRKAH